VMVGETFTCSGDSTPAAPTNPPDLAEGRSSRAGEAGVVSCCEPLGFSQGTPVLLPSRSPRTAATWRPPAFAIRQITNDWHDSVGRNPSRTGREALVVQRHLVTRLARRSLIDQRGDRHERLRGSREAGFLRDEERCDVR
jgi:hypothetical protein